MMTRSARDKAHGFNLPTEDQYSRKKLDVGMISQIINDTARPHQGNVKKVKTIRQGIKNPLPPAEKTPKRNLNSIPSLPPLFNQSAPFFDRSSSLENHARRIS